MAMRVNANLQAAREGATACAPFCYLMTEEAVTLPRTGAPFLAEDVIAAMHPANRQAFSDAFLKARVPHDFAWRCQPLCSSPLLTIR